MVADKSYSLDMVVDLDSTKRVIAWIFGESQAPSVVGQMETLIGGVTLGLVNPTLGCLADKYYLSKVSTFGIFIISGLTLRSDAIGAAAKAWPVGVFGLCSILLFTPYFSRLILLIRLQPQEFVTAEK
ncbi:putative sodium bile acid cotransporter protein [Corchorus olitorius]|uniref:Sodium bile acid cotransporter protein n=1 Tax=Corchorus olitorius TaxID=93759 RepID=A0A1R3I913_9ROSI|nr:putative sodium bile acid cotransporter protein [Corchorus olitorius]